MPTYNRGEVVTLRYPYSNNRGFVVRPAVVVSTQEHNDGSPDVIVVAQITSRIQVPLQAGDFLIQDSVAAHLDRPSKARMTKLFTVAKTEIRKSIGQFSGIDLQAIDDNLRIVLGL